MAGALRRPPGAGPAGPAPRPREAAKSPPPCAYIPAFVMQADRWAPRRNPGPRSASVRGL
ncbi:MAG: hypothetical protein DBY09_08470 [Selenomonadales bacterium]|nr:MAG: hypothetical protein DBY09_08470 [Selenomonadales bacterium]